MLNYIWSGLIIASLVFALAFDIGDLARDTYRNGEALPVEIALPAGYDPGARAVPVEVRIDAAEYRAFYGTDTAPAGSYGGTLVQSEDGRILRFEAGAALPEPLATIQGVSQSNDGELQGSLVGFDAAAVDLGHDGLGRHAMTNRRCGEMADIHGGADGALAGIKIVPHRIKCGILHCGHHHRRGEHGRQGYVLELVREVGGRDAQRVRASGSNWNCSHRLSVPREECG